LALAIVIAACGGGVETETFAGPCNLADALREPGRLTVATAADGPAPWVLGRDPAEGRGFEAALVYAIADELGIDSVVWTESSREEALSPGGRDFDFAIQQLPIADAATAVAFSAPYYQVEQVLVGKPNESTTAIKRLADLGDLRLGVLRGTNGIDYVETEIVPDTPPLEFASTADAAAGLDDGDVDGILLGLPTAYAMIAGDLPDAAILFILPRVDETPEQLGMAFAESSRLVPCIDEAVEALSNEGNLDELELEWLDQQGRIPSLNP
jgi:polar amino acid transport system substrate-binding protein